MASFREEMPVLARHEGDWMGTYTLVDLQGNILDRHESHLTCEFPTEGIHYYQTNREQSFNFCLMKYNF